MGKDLNLESYENIFLNMADNLEIFKLKKFFMQEFFCDIILLYEYK